MSRDEVKDLFGAEADSIQLLSLDPSPLLQGTIEALRNACGTDWQLDDPDPNHDCSQTALGQSFNGGDWQNSAEFSMVRILTMTPAK